MHKSNRVESENLLECHNERVYGSYHFFSRLCFIFFSRALKFQEEIHLEQFRLDRHFFFNSGFLMAPKEYCHAVTAYQPINFYIAGCIHKFVFLIFGKKAHFLHKLIGHHFLPCSKFIIELFCHHIRQLHRQFFVYTKIWELTECDQYIPVFKNMGRQAEKQIIRLSDDEL